MARPGTGMIGETRSHYTGAALQMPLLAGRLPRRHRAAEGGRRRRGAAVRAEERSQDRERPGTTERHPPRRQDAPRADRVGGAAQPWPVNVTQ